MLIRIAEYCYLLEFKVSRGDEGATAAAAVAQIQAKGYAEPYMGQGTIWLIGAVFDPDKRNLIDFECKGYPV